MGTDSTGLRLRAAASRRERHRPGAPDDRRWTAGSSIVNVLPRPGSLCTDTRAAVRLDDALHEVEAEAAALNLPRDRLAAAIERLEDVLAILGVDAEPAILDGDARRRRCGARRRDPTQRASPPYLMALLIRF